MRQWNEGLEMGDVVGIDTTYVASASTTQKRSGSYSLKLGPTGTGNKPWARKSLPVAVSEYFFRYGMYGVPVNLVSTQAGIGGTTQLSLVFVDDHTLNITVGGVTRAYVPPFALSATWNLIECYHKIDATVGRVIVKVEGVVIADFTGNTRNGSDTIQSIYFEGGTVSNVSYFDDMALNDTDNSDGAGDTSWCGDGHFIALTPNGNGDTNQWAGSDGNSTDNYLLVDETPKNDDTDYVEDATAGHQDMYNVGDWDESGNKVVLRVWAEARGRDTVAVGGQIKVGVKTNGSVYLSDALSLLTTYALAQKGTQYTVNPQTGLPWTNTEMDAVQFVVEAE